MKLIEQIRRDREAGTPGSWDASSRNVYASAREDESGNKDGCLAVIVSSPVNDWIAHHDTCRIARVPAMEEALLAAVEALKAIERGDDSADGMPGVIAGAALDAMGVGQ